MTAPSGVILLHLTYLLLFNVQLPLRSKMVHITVNIDPAFLSFSLCFLFNFSFNSTILPSSPSPPTSSTVRCARCCHCVVAPWCCRHWPRPLRRPKSNILTCLSPEWWFIKKLNWLRRRIDWSQVIIIIVTHYYYYYSQWKYNWKKKCTEMNWKSGTATREAVKIISCHHTDKKFKEGEF